MSKELRIFALPFMALVAASAGFEIALWFGLRFIPYIPG